MLSANIFKDYSEKIAITNIALKDFCKMYELNLSSVLSILKRNGITVKAKTNIGKITQKNNIGPMDLYKMISGQ